MLSSPIPDISKVPLSAELAVNFNLANNTIIQKAALDPINGNLVEVGDSKQPEFYPQLKIMRWENEVNFSARLVDLDSTTPTMEITGNVIKYKKATYEAHYYDIGFADDTGGFVDELILNSKPATNVIQWTLQTKGLDFFYQDALTAQEIADGCSRTDHIVGSYAVYHSTQSGDNVGGKNYRAGKAFHIFAPLATDAKGNTSKSTLNISNGIMTATINQAFLDSSAYPISIK